MHQDQEKMGVLVNLQLDSVLYGNNLNRLAHKPNHIYIFYVSIPYPPYPNMLGLLNQLWEFLPTQSVC